MSVNQSVNHDPRSFMYYNGDCYVNKTEIIFSEEFINNNTVNGKKIWPYAYFDRQETNARGVVYFFVRNKATWLDLHGMGVDPKTINDYAPYVTIEAYNIDKAIGKVTHPIKLKQQETQAIKEAMTTSKSSDFDHPILMLLWLVYIVVMAGSLIFQHFYIIWIIASYVFFQCRKEILRQ